MLLALLCYPMRLQQGWLGPMVGKWKATETSSAWSKFCVEQFEPFISFYHSPLILKGTLAAACIMAAAGAAFAVLMLRPLLTPRTLLRTEPLMLRLAGLRRFGFLLAFLLWSALSASWSPTRALSLDVLFWIAIFGGFAWLLLRRGISYDETRQLGLLLLLIGTVVAVVCLLEATEAFHGIIFDFLLRFDDALRRNIYGSLIGHNSAVGSFMLMTAFIAFAFAVDARSAIARWAAIAYLGLDLMAAFTTQSRSTWIFGPILGTAYLVVASRQRGRSWPWRLIFYVAALLAMGFCSQTIHSRWNPFYLTDNPFAKRIRDLSYRGFAGDARARLFVCSLPLVAEKPITGHGLYSFQYVYPKAQGEYFARHPGSKLSRTTFRSDMAHDEYLQILVEQGVIGLTLFLLTLGEIYWRGRRTSISLSGPSKLLHASFGFAVLAFCCDALVNFPLHVPPLVVPWIFCLAAFGGFQMVPSSASEPISEPAEAPALEEAELSPGTFRSGHVARLVVAWSAALALPFFVYPFARAFQADVDFMYGQSYMNSIRQDGPRMDPRMRESLFQNAAVHFRRAIILQRAHDSARYQLGERYYLHGYYLASDEKMAAAGSPPLYTQAINEVKTGIQYIEQSMEGLRYHNSFYTLALSYELLRTLSGDPEEQAEYSKRYKENLEASLFYCPTLVQSAIMLDRWLCTQPVVDKARVVSLRKMIRAESPGMFNQFYEREYHRRYEEQNYPAAAEGVESLLEVDPDDPAYLIFAIEAQMWAGNHARAVQLIEHLKQVKPDPAKYTHPPIYDCYGELYEGMIQRRWADVLKTLDIQYADLPRNIAMLYNIELYARNQIGIQGLASRFKRPAGYSEDDWVRLVAEQKAVVLYFLIRDLDAARKAFTERLAMKGPIPKIAFFADNAWLARELKDKALLDTCLREIRAQNPKYPTLAILERPMDPPPAAAAGPGAP